MSRVEPVEVLVRTGDTWSEPGDVSTRLSSSLSTYPHVISAVALDTVRPTQGDYISLPDIGRLFLFFSSALSSLLLGTLAVEETLLKPHNGHLKKIR